MVVRGWDWIVMGCRRKNSDVQLRGRNSSLFVLWFFAESCPIVVILKEAQMYVIDFGYDLGIWIWCNDRMTLWLCLVSH
jgi:hypothetical protein